MRPDRTDSHPEAGTVREPHEVGCLRGRPETRPPALATEPGEAEGPRVHRGGTGGPFVVDSAQLLGEGQLYCSEYRKRGPP